MESHFSNEGIAAQASRVVLVAGALDGEELARGVGDGLVEILVGSVVVAVHVREHRSTWKQVGELVGFNGARTSATLR